MSSDLEGLNGQTISIDLPTDENGFTGRECPNENCLGYFKIVFGTGLPGVTACVCPYCGKKDEHDRFATPDQNKYIESVAMRHLMGTLHQDLKKLEFEIRPPRNAMFGIGISLKVEPHRPLPLHQYAEAELETHVECDRCTLKYAIYGVFGYCPDCGTHNSLDILHANLDLITKMLELAAQQSDSELAERLIGNAVEGCVSSFDGWGRAVVEAFAHKATDPAKATASFQNIKRAKARVSSLFDYDLARAVSPEEFTAVEVVFQKRHVLAHRMGVVDQAYIDSTGDRSAAVGRKLRFNGDEIRAAISTLRRIAAGLVSHLEATP